MMMMMMMILVQLHFQCSKVSAFEINVAEVGSCLTTITLPILLSVVCMYLFVVKPTGA